MAEALPLRLHLPESSVASQAKVELTPLTVDAKRLAGLLGQSLRTIRTWDASGKLPQPLRIGGRVVWRLEEINAWLEAGAQLRTVWNAIRKQQRN